MPQSSPIVRPFDPDRDAPHFRRLNEAWLKAHFHVEPIDEQLFADPVGHFIRPGGAILMLDDEVGRTVGCCALINLGGGHYEIAKLAVADTHRGRGLGRLLMEATIDHARGLGARRLFIETSHKLPAAIALYEKLGFGHLSGEQVPPSEYSRADVFMERWL